MRWHPKFQRSAKTRSLARRSTKTSPHRRAGRRALAMEALEQRSMLSAGTTIFLDPASAGIPDQSAISIPSAQITPTSTPTLDGVTSPGDTVTVYAASTANPPVQLNPGPASGEDVLLGTATADINGNWSLTAAAENAGLNGLGLNNLTYFPTTYQGNVIIDGERDLTALVTDNNGNAVGDPATLPIFVDSAGPRVASVVLSNGQDAFATTPSGPNTPQGSTLDIVFTDAALRSASGIFSNLPALNNVHALVSSNYQLSGQASGVDPIQSVNFTDETQPGGPGTTDITLTFANPLVDDVYTLTIDASNAGDVAGGIVPGGIANDAGDRLDGTVTAASGGSDTINLPSGSGTPGSFGNFVASFAVQGGTELAVAMTQGVQFYDLQGAAAAGTTMVAPLGNPSDVLFTGDFADPSTGLADGFSKLAAYGKGSNGQFRFLFQSDDGGPTTSVVSPLQITALPVAGDFDGNSSAGDQVGLFTGKDWYIFSRDFSSYTTIPWSHPGLPVVGDFDGDGIADLATWSNGTFYVALSSTQDNYAQIDVTIPFNLPSATVRPVAADISGDGVDDLGLWLPNNGVPSTAKPGDWYFLDSSTPITQWTTVPTPLHYQFGSSVGVPLTGNFTAETVGVATFSPALLASSASTASVMMAVPAASPSVVAASTVAAPAAKATAPVVNALRTTVVVAPVVAPAVKTTVAATSVATTSVATAATARGPYACTAGNDTISLVPGKTPGTWTLTIDGVAHAIGLSTKTLNLDGLGGSNTITIVGTGKDESAEIWSNHLVFHSGSLTVTAAHVANITVRGGGNDKVVLHDAAGKNSFVSSAGVAKLTGTGYSEQAQNFASTRVYSTPGAVDTAVLYQPANQSTTSRVGDVVAVSAAGTTTQAVSFNQVQVLAKSGAVTTTYVKPAGAAQKPKAFALTKLATTTPALKTAPLVSSAAKTTPAILGAAVMAAQNSKKQLSTQAVDAVMTSYAK